MKMLGVASGPLEASSILVVLCIVWLYPLSNYLYLAHKSTSLVLMFSGVK